MDGRDPDQPLKRARVFDVAMADEQDEVASERAETLVARGVALAEGNPPQFRAAISMWTRALELQEDAAVLDMCAQASMEEGDHFAAIQFADRACALSPEWADARVTLGRAQLNFGEVALASRSLALAIELGCPDADVAEDLARVQQLLEAHPSLRSARLMDPHEVDHRIAAGGAGLQSEAAVVDADAAPRGRKRAAGQAAGEPWRE